MKRFAFKKPPSINSNFYRLEPVPEEKSDPFAGIGISFNDGPA